MAVVSLSLTPSCVHALPGEEVRLEIEGGSGDYSYSATGGRLFMDEDLGNTLYFSADSEDTFYIWLTDGEDMAYSCVDTGSGGRFVAFSAIPSSVTLRVDESLRLAFRAYRKDGTWEAVSDPDEYTISPENINIVEYDDGVLYGVSPGKATIKFEYEGLEAEVDVEVKEALRALVADPSSITLEKGSETYFNLILVTSGGRRQDVTDDASISVKDPSIAELSAGEARIIAKEVGITALEASYGQAVVFIPITVLPSQALGVMPSEITLEPGEEWMIRPYGGRPPYRVVAETGKIATSKGGVFVYSPGAGGGGEDTITVIDDAGDEVTCQVRVIEPLKVTPSEVTARAGEIQEFRAVGGDGTYYWMVNHGELSTFSGEEVEYTPPERLGKHVVTVFDSSGHSAEAVVWAGKGVSVSPGTVFLVPDEEVEIAIVGGLPPMP